MAEEALKTAPEVAMPTEEEVVVTDVPQAEKPAVEKVPPPMPETDEPVKPAPPQEPSEKEVSKPCAAADEEKMPESVSFKEESTKLSDLLEPEKKALQELKLLIQEALNKHEFTTPAPPPPPLSQSATVENPAAKETQILAKETDSSEAANSNALAPLPEEPAKLDSEISSQPVTAGEKVVVAQVIEPIAVATAVDDDGAKTVEAIEETIVAVSNSASQEHIPEAKEPEGAPPPSSTEEKTKDDGDEAPVAFPEEVSIWGIKLLEDEQSDVILLKFLRARDFKVKDAFAMIRNTVRWRKEFGIDELLEQDLGSDLEKVVFMHGSDKDQHPVCYNVYGEFQNRELYRKTFSDEEKRQKFLRWRIQFLERSIRKLDFSPGGICTIVQVNDLKNSPGPGKWELRQATKQGLHLLQDNYPEFVAKQIFINVPWWYLAVNRMISPFLTQRTKSKFVFAGPSKSAETLLRYIAAEQLPVKYGGLSKDGEFSTGDAVTEITVKPAAKQLVEFPVTEACLLTWEMRVVGWEVRYGAEFVPSAKEAYTVIIQKVRKVGSAEEAVACNSFKAGEPGKVVLTVDNATSKKKKLLYRLKTKPYSD